MGKRGLLAEKRRSSGIEMEHSELGAPNSGVEHNRKILVFSHLQMEPVVGVEPTTDGFQNRSILFACVRKNDAFTEYSLAISHESEFVQLPYYVRKYEEIVS